MDKCHAMALMNYCCFIREIIGDICFNYKQVDLWIFLKNYLNQEIIGNFKTNVQNGLNLLL